MSNINLIICNNTSNECSLLNAMMFDINSSPDFNDKKIIAAPCNHNKGVTTFKSISSEIVPLKIDHPNTENTAISHRFSFMGAHYSSIEFFANDYCSEQKVQDCLNANCVIFAIDAKIELDIEMLKWIKTFSLLKTQKVIWAVDYISSSDFNEEVFAGLVEKLTLFSRELGFPHASYLPLSISTGENISSLRSKSSWYQGANLMEQLSLDTKHSATALKATRLQVIQADRSNDDSGFIEGILIQGKPQVGDKLKVLPSGAGCTIKSIEKTLANKETNLYSDRIKFSIAESFELKSGVILGQGNNLPEMADQFEANLLWLHNLALIPGRQYKFKLYNQEVNATVNKIKYRINENTGDKLACQDIKKNEIATVNISLDKIIIFDPFKNNHTLGFFSLIDKSNSVIVGLGTINHLLRRSQNIHWQEIQVMPETRAALMNQKPKCIWMTGLSGSGKSTIANMLEQSLNISGLHTFLLDGDNVRHGLNRDLGFTEADRAENIRRVAEVAKLMVEAGLIVIVSFISPFRSDREMARQRFQNDQFVEVFIDTPLEECEKRDTKGLYAKARLGEIQNFTGINSPYEAPVAADIHIRTTENPTEQAVSQIRQYLNL